MRYIKNNDLICEMSNLRSEETGIENVVIYVGPPDQRHWHRVKISNIANKYSSDNFVISIPNYEIIEGSPNKWINKKIPQILEFLKSNEQVIIDYSEEKITIDEFLNSLIKI